MEPSVDSLAPLGWQPPEKGPEGSVGRLFCMLADDLLEQIRWSSTYLPWNVGLDHVDSAERGEVRQALEDMKSSLRTLRSVALSIRTLGELGLKGRETGSERVRALQVVDAVLAARPDAKSECELSPERWLLHGDLVALALELVIESLNRYGAEAPVVLKAFSEGDASVFEVITPVPPPRDDCELPVVPSDDLAQRVSHSARTLGMGLFAPAEVARWLHTELVVERGGQQTVVRLRVHPASAESGLEGGSAEEWESPRQPQGSHGVRRTDTFMGAAGLAPLASIAECWQDWTLQAAGALRANATYLTRAAGLSRTFAGIRFEHYVGQVVRALEGFAGLGRLVGGRTPEPCSVAEGLRAAAARYPECPFHFALAQSVRVRSHVSVAFALSVLIEGAKANSPRGSTVRVWAGKVDEQLVIDVCDDGVLSSSMDPAYLVTVAGQEVARARRSGRYYPGLGLVAVRACTDGAHGHLEAHQERRGARLRLALPVRELHN